jgi:hypothetical protein
MPFVWRTEVKENLAFKREINTVGDKEARSSNLTSQLTVDYRHLCAHFVEVVQKLI